MKYIGYKLDADGRACIDENECQIYGKCSQLCRNIKGHYKCSCSSGYQLEPDGKTCKVTGQCSQIQYEMSISYTLLQGNSSPS